MKKDNNHIMVKPIILLVILIIIFIVGGNYMLSIKNNEKKHNAPLAYDDFDLNYLKYENSKDNLIYSPLSIKYALNMLKDGASGNTLKELENVFDSDNITKYDNIDKVLSLANAIYIKEDFKDSVKDEYIKELNMKYNAEVKYDPFENANNINKWIEDKTLNIIKDMLKDNQVKQANLKMLLINALAIDMEWALKFKTEDTFKDIFKNNKEELEVTMMHLSVTNEDNQIAYYQDKKITALSMPLKKYNDTQLEFIAIMPEDNLSNYIANLSTEDITNTIDKLAYKKSGEALSISIPKFNYNYEAKLKEYLNELGIQEVFTDNANLSKISTVELKAGDVIHKADIDFSEEGIKAAAVTIVPLLNKGILQDDYKWIDITFNKPFIYLIKDKSNNTIWFVGSVYKPNLWENDKAEYGY